MNKEILAALACAASLLAGQASAQPDAHRRLVVPYSDLDVTHERGARTLLARIEHAAKVLCGSAADSRDLTVLANYKACLRETTERAVADANVPMVSELYSGPPAPIAENPGTPQR